MNNIIDSLIHTAVFSENQDEKTKARLEIRALAKKQGIIPFSIYPFYMAIGNGKIIQTFTVPAINIRALTYDSACIIFDLIKTHAIGPVVFEIARSEIEYTNQQPDEYAVAVLAAALKTNYKGPVFLQGDHYQFSKRKYGENKEQETNKIKNLIKESIEAQFYNIDIDASTLVELEKPAQSQQQETNYKVTTELTQFIRSLEPKNTTISIGGEIGHIGGKNSTKEELIAFMEGYSSLINTNGISKISVQTGTSHGGIPLTDGTMADVKLDFSVLQKTGAVAKDKYHIGGVVQHGASTLPNELFDQFPKNNTLEIHLATGFQNIVYDNMTRSLREKMYVWIEENCKKEWEQDWSKEQFIYKTRKKALGPFKKDLWTLSTKDKQPILDALKKQFEFLFDKLGVFDTRKLINEYYPM